MRGRIGPATASVVLMAATACAGGGGAGGGGVGAATTDPTAPEAAAGPSGSTTPTATTGGATGTTTVPEGSLVTGGPGSGPRSGAGGGAGSGSGGGCPANGGIVPGDAVTAPVVDVDGDGRQDEVWYSSAGSPRMGIATASGTVVAATLHSGRAPRAAVVADADERGPVEVLPVTDGTAFLLVFQDCDLVPVIGPDGVPYAFDLGFRGNGTGVTCTDADGDGRSDLVGVNLVENGDGTATLSRTVVELDGTTASHGHHDERTVPGYEAEPEQTDRYHGVDCGPTALTPEMIEP